MIKAKKLIHLLFSNLYFKLATTCVIFYMRYMYVHVIPLECKFHDDDDFDRLSCIDMYSI